MKWIFIWYVYETIDTYGGIKNDDKVHRETFI